MPSSLSPKYDSATAALPTPKAGTSMDGWTFLGWATSSGGTTVAYSAGNTISASTVNTIFGDVGEGGTYTLYAVWRRTYTATFVDYADGAQRTRDETATVYNGASATLSTSEIAQGDHSGWTKAGWTMLKKKGASGSALASTLTLSDGDLFDFDTWSTSTAANRGSGQTVSYDADTKTLTSVSTAKDTATAYPSSTSSGYYYFEVDPYKTYTLGVDFAGTGDGQIGILCFDENGTRISNSAVWLFSPSRGFGMYRATGSNTTFRHEDFEFCPAIYTDSANSNAYLSFANRTKVRYVSLAFGNWSDNALSNGQSITAVYRNVTFTENKTYSGVYTQAVSLTYAKNTTDTVTGMPSNPSSQNRVANSYLGFGSSDIENPTFTVSSDEPARTGYRFDNWSDGTST